MITIFTAFGPTRFWTLELWAASIRGLGLDLAEVDLVVIDNTCSVTQRAKLIDRLWELAPGRFCLIGSPARIPRKDARAVAAHLAGLWNRMAPLVDTDLVLSLESDIEPAPGTLKALRAVIGNDLPIVGTPCRSRQRKHLMVYELLEASPWTVTWRPPPVQRGLVVVGSVSLGCTLIQTSFLRTVTLTGTTANRHGHEYSLMKACTESGHRILCDFSHPPKHYLTPENHV